MSDEFIKNVFDTFSRANDSRVRDVQGTGLGLSISRNLLQMMNGTISVDSRLNEGTKFTVTLFLELQEVRESKNAGEPGSLPDNSEYEPHNVTLESITPSRAAGFEGKRALLVEDNELNVEIASEILSMVDLEVEIANDGSEAVKMFSASAERYYDIIFMDIQMPVMDGYTAARTIRGMSRSDAASLPIIAMTANAFAEDIQKSRDAGMNEHISKPIEIDKLFSVIGKWLG